MVRGYKKNCRDIDIGATNMLLQKIKKYLFGPPDSESKSGLILSSDGPENDHRPRLQRVMESVEIDERTPEPDDDGWIRLPNRDRYRKLPIGSMGSGMSTDKPRGRFRTIDSSRQKDKW